MNQKLIKILALLWGTMLFQCSTNVTNPNDNFELEKLKSICNVWGLMKYYHPGVGSGEIDWDNKLIDLLQKSENIGDKSQFNQLIERLIESCNNYSAIKVDSNILTGEIKYVRDFLWLEDTSCISYRNTTLLHNIINSKKPYINYYVSQNNDIGNLNFDNEKSYSDSTFPSKNLRLLALFRYWNIINYFYPHLELNDAPWDSILNNYIPKFIYSNNTLDYHLLVQELTSQLNDGHILTESMEISFHWGIYSPPYKLRCIDKKPIISSFFPDSLGILYDITIGDEILSINGKSIEDIIDKRLQYFSFSNPNQYNRRIFEELLITSNSDSIILVIKRNEKTLQTTLPTFFLYDLYQILEREESCKSTFKVIGDSIGLINLRYLEKVEVNPMMDSLLDLDKIIIDIRNYPHGVLYELSKYFNPSPIDFVTVFMPDLNRPGNFIWWEQPLQTGIHNDNYYKGEIVLIVNEQTQSHAEFTAMCLQASPNVTTIGSMTAGADGNISYVILPGDIYTYFTGIGIEYPDGTPTQRIGIKIDSIVLPQIQDFKNNYDRLLDCAIHL